MILVEEAEFVLNNIKVAVRVGVFDLVKTKVGDADGTNLARFTKPL